MVSETLGHSSIAITLDLYSHVTPTMQREAAAVLDSVLGAVCALREVRPTHVYSG